MTRPLTILIAGGLLLASAAMSAVGSFVQYAALDEVAAFSATRGVQADAAAMGSLKSLLLWKGGLTVTFLAGLAALLVFGRSRAARLLLTIGIVGGMAVAVLFLRATMGGLGLIQAIVEAAAVVLMWLPASGAWLQAGKAGKA